MLLISAPIETTRLRLRPFLGDDLCELHAIHSDPEVVRYLYWEPRSREEVAEVLAQRKDSIRIAAANDVIVLAVERIADGRVIGEVTLAWRSVEHRQAEIGFVFDPRAGGRGYATEATAVLVELAFKRLRAHRVYGRTDPRNERSAKLMRRLGMRQEAHFRECEIFKGEWGDELVLGILASEWRGVGKDAIPSRL